MGAKQHKAQGMEMPTSPNAMTASERAALIWGIGSKGVGSTEASDGYIYSRYAQGGIKYFDQMPETD